MSPLRFIILMLFVPLLVHAKPIEIPDLPAIDSTYRDEIASIAFHPTSVVTGYPIVDLGRGQFTLKFDDLDGEFNKYRYSFYHCNQYWEYSTQIREFDYRRGFVEEDIFDFELSLGTDVPYAHFTLKLPNRDNEFLISGNYLLVVYKYIDGERYPAFTRRFMVVDNRLDIRVDQVPPRRARFSRTHHELDIYAGFDDFSIRNPFKEVNAYVYQNGIWSRGYTQIAPQTVQRNEISFRYPTQIIFPAIKEFRYFDIRNLNFRTERVFNIYRKTDTIDVILETDRPRGDSYFTYFDINGRYVFQNMDGIRRVAISAAEEDEIGQILNDEENQMNRRIELMSQYANVHFTLDRDEIPGKDIYVVGAFNDYKLDEDSRLNYDEQEKIYFKTLLLKQGYFEYLYVTRDRITGEVDWTEIEGSRFETINDYLIFIYYRPFGTFYDQLIGMKTFQSDNL
jgi:hypothetical protein